jgi:RNA polymerase sigma-70 factor (ECF subfamily)
VKQTMRDEDDESAPDRSSHDYEAYSDEQLVQLCCRQLPDVTDAYQVLLERYRQPVYLTCLRYLQDPAEAQDACQEVFFRVFLYIGTFAGHSSFWYWLSRIAQNQCRRQAGRQARIIAQQSVAGSDTLDGQSFDAILPVSPPVIEINDVKDVQDTLQKLPDNDREVLQLRFFADASMEEIAASLGIELSAAKMRLLRAKERFKAVYMPLDGGQPQAT